jgi:Zn-finger nucleic acid-binding protein
MESVTYQGVEVERCVECRGIWFDVLEPEVLSAREGSERIDDGVGGGIKFNFMESVRCPVCSVVMERVVDPQVPQVFFESCPKCLGTFFDAGEFRDFKEGIVVDAVRRIRTRE